MLFRSSERKKAETLYTDYEEAKKSFSPGDEYDLVDKTARLLRFESYYSLVPEQEYLDKTRNERKPSGKQLNMAVVMYMVSAIKYLDNEERDAVRKIAFEIAEKGKSGINLDSTELDQTLESLPGKEFTGLQLSAWMYIAWKRIEPTLDTSLDYDEEYEAALKMVELTRDKLN